MARTKQTARHSLSDWRTTWTRFHLPRGQDWPWPAGPSNEHRGPLVGVAGCEKVWLGRKVEDPEQAALIILWNTAGDLRNFQNSPACHQFLQSLPEKGMQASLMSGALLRDLSLDDTDTAPLPSASSRLLGLSWCRYPQDLEGRVTLTTLVTPHTDGPSQYSPYSAVWSTLDAFVPPGCQDIRAHWPRQYVRFWASYARLRSEEALVNRHLLQPGQDIVAAGIKSGQEVWYQFRFWNGFGGATPEREEASANHPLAGESWAQTVAKVMPPVTAWEQERWDVQLVPVEVVEESEGEIDWEYERELDEFCKQSAAEGQRRR